MSGNLRSIRGSLSAGGVAATLGLLLTIAAVTAMAEKGKQPAVEPNTTDANTADANDPNAIAKRFTVSKETTFIKGPRNKDGTINYVAWLRKHYSKGVTHKNNAAVLLVQAMGPEMLPEDHLAEYRKELGLRLPEDGEYFQTWSDYVKAFGLDREKYRERLDEAMVAPWTAQDRPHLAKWLKKNAKPLALARQASKRDRWYCPFVVESEPPQIINMYEPSLLRSRFVCRALIVEAMRKLGNGDAAGASEDLLAAHRLGRLVGRGPSLIGPLIGLTFDAAATRGSEALMQSTGIKPGVLRKHLAAMNKLPAIPSMSESINLYERFFALDSVQVVIREGFVLGKTLNVIQGQGVDKAAGKGRGIPWWMIDFDVMLKRVNDEYDRVVKLAQAKSGEELKRLGREHTEHLVVEMKLHSEEQIWRQKVALALLPNKIRARRIGEMLSDVIVNLQLPSVTRAVEMQRQQEAEVDLVRVSLALRLYQADTGKLPEKLSALAPKYVKKVPRDWFGATGKLVYRASESGKGFVVYSVGMNGSDDGGFGEDGLTPPADDDEADDIAVWYRYGEQDSGE